MPAIEVYASQFCPYCRWARALLDNKGVEYQVFDVDRDPQLRREMIARSGRTSVPQIFIDDYHVGGFDDLSALDRAGKLDELISSNAAHQD